MNPCGVSAQPLAPLWTFTIALLLFLQPANEAQLIRVPNATLQMPQTPAKRAGYALEPAFGVAFNQAPVALAIPPGETNRLFVVEKTGMITLLTDLAAPTATARPFLNLNPTGRALRLTGEAGALGLTFHPNFAENGFFYVFYTPTNPPGSTSFFNRLSRFRVSDADRNVADPNSELVLINQPDLSDVHNAGDLHFGPDGYLYVSLGDGGSATNSQQITKDFFSGILRIDVDRRATNLPANPHPAASTNYAIPADNPFIGATEFNGAPITDPSKVRTEFYAVGLRNPWRMSFDFETAALWCGDVGDTSREEINLIAKGANYGWNYFEGSQQMRTPPAGFQHTAPIFEYGRTDGGSVIGGRVYRGNRIPQLHGAYVFADFLSPGNVWALRLDQSGAAQTEVLFQNSRISAFGVDPSNGDLLAASMADGTIRRLVNRDASGDPLPPLLSDVGAFSDVATLTPAPGVVPYDVNLPFWSDGATKKRWFSIPNSSDQITFNESTTWLTPTGSVWIKHFEIQMTNGQPASVRRLETRVLVRNPEGLYGVTYRWLGNTNATLVPDNGATETLAVNNAGVVRNQVWRYPSRNECLACHNIQAGWVLGFNTAQMNRDFTHGAVTENQLTSLANAGYLTGVPPAPQTLPALAQPDDTSTSQEFRLRSYLAANCAQCHRPAGPALGYFDARLHVPTDEASLIEAPVAAVIMGRNVTLAPNNLNRSMLHYRITSRTPGIQMPPIGVNVPDPAGAEVLRAFIVGESVTRKSFNQWAQINFTDPLSADAAPQSDPDADAAPNVLEYLTSGNPLQPGDEWRLQAKAIDGRVELRFRNPANRAVIVESATDAPTGWTPLDSPQNRMTFPAVASERVVTDTTSTERVRFYRARISAP